MKLVTSTGDFSYYAATVAQKVRLLAPTKFKYVNLEQTGNIPEFFEDSDLGYKRLAEDFKLASLESGLSYVVSHAPCLHTPTEGETYKANMRAILRSIDICHMLGIPRIVVHACASEKFDKSDFYKYNEKFYREILDFAERREIMIMTENWDRNSTNFSTGREIREFLDYMNHPLLCACWDTAHGNIDAVAREIGQYNNITDIGDKLKGMHISDNFGDTHHHSFPFAGIINFDSVMQGLIDVNYDGYFTFEASYTLLHQHNLPYTRKNWEYKGNTVEKLLNPSISLKQKAVDLLYETGKYILESYGLYEE